MTDKPPHHLPSGLPAHAQAVFEREAEAEAAQRRLAEEGQAGLDNRCPSCGALGSLEERGDDLVCIDCDLTVAAESRLGGLGRK